ncbi:hypothetical protein RM780_18600 [Streptomyces sp. DSM 44917]|uniref:Uncharacterized protein n=1 Tax=Streptomyces boetiae TaxID=3075541 RepID=A0ABU2LBK2_9ACTN|nr:hypothetical protein [Streptomyces sp. DSM 44917]MDT0308957.1 hypothetical protein [Streptomyces sp. DSM 44917]
MPGKDEGVVALPCHRWWDGARVPAFVGERVVAWLRAEAGPVIEDQVADSYTWLVRPGAADAWEGAGVEVLRHGSLPVPPPHFTAGAFSGGASLRWLVPPTATCLSDPARLAAALRLAGREAGHG